MNRYRTYSYILRERLSQYAELEPSLAEADFAEEEAAAASVLSSTTTSLSSTTSSTSGQSIVATPLAEGCSSLVPPPVPERRPSPTNRYSYRAAIYNHSITSPSGGSSGGGGGGGVGGGGGGGDIG